MSQIYDQDPYDYQNELPVWDATLQDFGPIAAGLGVGAKALAGLKAAPQAVKAAIVSAGPLLKRGQEYEALVEQNLKNVKPATWEAAERLFDKYTTLSTKARDFAEVLRLKALKAMAEQTQMTADDFINQLVILHMRGQ